MNYLAAIYDNVHVWLVTRGSNVLDNFIVPNNVDQVNPEDRYTEFFFQLEKHFGSSMFWKATPGVDLPVLILDVSQVSQPGSCKQVYMLDFKVQFQAISPAVHRICVENSPLGMYKYIDSVDCALTQMLMSEGRTLFSDNLTVDQFDYKVHWRPFFTEYPVENVKVVEEVVMFNKQYLLTFYDCGGNPNG